MHARRTLPTESVVPVDDFRDDERLPPLTRRGAYEILELLGEGGMGRVYLAQHTALGREVALKILRRPYAQNAGAVARFFNEARAVNRIAHENIVEITDFVDDGEEKYTIMELLRGQTLGALVAEERPLPLARTLHIMRQVASALAAVHRAHIVHRDLKPDNIFITKRGQDEDFVKVLDFGVAKLSERAGKVATTVDGAIVGTPQYMAPEQLSGKPIDHRVDVYAFSLVLYEMVTGVRAFEATAFGDLVVKHLTQMPVPARRVQGLPHRVPRALDALINQGLSKDPERRPATMEDVLARLDEIWAEQNARGPLGPRRTLPGRLRWLMVGGCGAALALAAAVPLARSSPPQGASSAERLVRVMLESSPSGAEVQIEDALVGTTPCEAVIPPRASVSIRFALPGYEPVTVEDDVFDDALLKVALARSPVPPPQIEEAEPPAPRSVPRSSTRARGRDRRVGDLLDPFSD